METLPRHLLDIAFGDRGACMRLNLGSLTLFKLISAFFTVKNEDLHGRELSSRWDIVGIRRDYLRVIIE